MLQETDRPARAFARLRRAALGGLIAAAIAAPGPALAQMQRADVDEAIRQYLAAHPEELGPAIEKYLAAHPEVVRNAILALAAKRGAPQAGVVDAKQAIADNAKALFSAPLQTTLGAPEGGPTIVEFFDFNCGYCRRALADTLTLIGDEPGLRIVLKEFPILGPDSVEAARVAIALQMRHPDAAASLEFHRRLLASPGRADRTAALAIASDLGFDAAQLEKDAASAEVNDALGQNMRLASALGVHGTPAYVVGDSVIPGAIGASALKARVAELRKP